MDNKTAIKERTFAEFLNERLRDRDNAAVYLSVALEEYEQDGDIAAFLLALRRVAEAQGGLGELAKRTELNRGNLYETLSTNGNPRFETIAAIFHALGLRLSATRAAS